MEFSRLRKSYDLYGFVKITNLFDQWQLDYLESSFDRFYQKRLGKHPDSTNERLPLLGAALEDIDIAKTVASSPWLLASLRAVAGEECQYLGSDIQIVYDDSIGTHRDTHYSYDMVKVLIFLSDCAPNVNHFDSSTRLGQAAGGFAVLSGSHIPCSHYSALASQLSDWPRKELSVRSDLTSEYHRGDLKSNQDFLYPVNNYDTRYQGFSHIPFKKGDVVIFSTRAFHALLPTHSSHYAKLIGLLFIEDFAKPNGRKLSINTDCVSTDEKEYMALPFNLRLADNIIKGASYEDAFESFKNYPMGLQNIIDSGDPLLTEAFSRHTTIYRISEAQKLDLFAACVSSKEAVLRVFEGNFIKERKVLKSYLDSTDFELSQYQDHSKQYLSSVLPMVQSFCQEAHALLALQSEIKPIKPNVMIKAKLLKGRLTTVAKKRLRILLRKLYKFAQ